MQQGPSQLIVSIIIVGGTILVMWMLKNVFGVESHASSADTSSYIEAHLGKEAASELSGSHQSASDHQSTEEIEPAEEVDSSEEQESEDETVVVVESSIEESNSTESEPVSDRIPQTSAYFEDLLADYYESVSALPQGESRTDIVVRYYTHAQDDNKISALKKLRLYIHERTPADSLEGYESNSIYYGDSVSNDDIRIITYTLLQNGFDVKQIVPSKFHDSWKARSIEIGTDLNVNSYPTLTLEEIQNFTNEFYPGTN